jgi:hypothetical protein
MSSGMSSDFRYWRKELAGNVRRVRALARGGDCTEAKKLYRETLRESGTSLAGWSMWIRLGNEVARRCKRKRKK